MTGIEPADRERLREAMMQVVDNQLKANDPPETAQTLERLMAEGCDEDEARNLIACAVVEIMTATLGGKPYDHERYLKLLARLPTRPWE